MTNTKTARLDPVPEECASRLFELCGVRFEPDTAVDLWIRVMDHKWLLSEKVGRDVGLKIACLDFLENLDAALDEHQLYRRNSMLRELGAQALGREWWDRIADNQPAKELIRRRIILPLTEEDLSRKHGVVPPKAIFFFGPPGTGKTSLAKAIAGILSWWYVEIVPSMLIADGLEKVGAHLRRIMENARNLNETVGR